MKTTILKTITLLLSGVLLYMATPAAGLVDPRQIELFSSETNNLRFMLFSEFLLFNNADLKAYDDSTPERVIATDDLFYTPWSILRIGYETSLDKTTQIRISLSKAGFWGGDELSQGSVSNGSYANTLGANPLSIDELYGTWRFPAKKPKAQLKVGRQRFSIDEQWFDDTIDAITLEIPEPWGTLNLLLFDWVGSVSALKNLPASLSSISSGALQQTGYKGDSASIRLGAAFRSPDLLDSPDSFLYLKGWFFLLRQGAGPGGNDRAGGWANFSDQDYIFLSGISLQASWEEWQGSLHGAYSGGIDRRQDTYTGENRDISISGWALRAKITHIKQIPASSASFSLSFHAGFSQGPTLKTQPTSSNPDDLSLASYGFCAFEGRPFGGLLLGRYGNFLPYSTPSTLKRGLYDPRWLSHRGGVIYLEGSFGLAFSEELRLDTNVYWVKDASTGLFIQNRLVSGLPIGVEINQSLTLKLSSHTQVQATGALFLPGKYAILTSFGGQTPFYGTSISTRFLF